MSLTSETSLRDGALTSGNFKASGTAPSRCKGGGTDGMGSLSKCALDSESTGAATVGNAGPRAILVKNMASPSLEERSEGGADGPLSSLGTHLEER